MVLIWISNFQLHNAHVFSSPKITKHNQIENNFIFRPDLLGETKQHFPAQEERSPYSGIEELGNLATFFSNKFFTITRKCVVLLKKYFKNQTGAHQSIVQVKKKNFNFSISLTYHTMKYKQFKDRSVVN